MPLIEMKNIVKHYRMGETTVKALNGIDLAIDSGEFVAAWGPSGTGKTTLLNLIGTIDEPTAGRLWIDGQDVMQLNDNRRTDLRNRRVGFIFQGFNLIPVLSALENVMLPLQIKGGISNGAKDKALERLETVGLADFVKHRPDKLSGGQQQRVAIARALVSDPAIVIADEPTANLDSDTARTIIGLMQELNRTENTTFIFSTHDQRLIGETRRLLRLEDGRIVEDSKPRENRFEGGTST